MQNTGTISPAKKNIPSSTLWLTRLRYQIFFGLGILLLLCLSIIMLAPFAWVFATSLRLPAQSFSVPPEWIPRDLEFGNYERVFEEIPFWSQIMNSASAAIAACRPNKIHCFAWLRRAWLLCRYHQIPPAAAAIAIGSSHAGRPLAKRNSPFR